MHQLIEICPYCHQECALPAPMKDLQNWPVICHSCDMIFETPNQKTPNQETPDQKTGNRQSSKPSSRQNHRQIICDHCHYQMSLPRGDFNQLCASEVVLSCPNCREDLLFLAAKRTNSGITAALIAFIFIAITASFWLVLTPQGEEARLFLRPYLTAPYHYLGELRLAFADLISFIRGLLFS